jgi:hypothetical protein
LLNNSTPAIGWAITAQTGGFLNNANVNRRELNVSDTNATPGTGRMGRCFVDCGHFGDLTGLPLYGFVMTLRYSHMRYLQFTHSRDVHQLMVSMVNGFHYFGGVPQEVFLDHIHAALLKPSGCEVLVDEMFSKFAANSGFKSRVCQGPETKGEIESTMRIVRRILLPGIPFGSLADLNQQAHAWIESLNRRMYRVTRKTPFELLLQEQLLPIDSSLDCNKNSTENSSLRHLQD